MNRKKHEHESGFFEEVRTKNSLHSSKSSASSASSLSSSIKNLVVEETVKHKRVTRPPKLKNNTMVSNGGSSQNNITNDQSINKSSTVPKKLKSSPRVIETQISSTKSSSRRKYNKNISNINNNNNNLNDKHNFISENTKFETTTLVDNILEDHKNKRNFIINEMRAKGLHNNFQNHQLQPHSAPEDIARTFENFQYLNRKNNLTNNNSKNSIVQGGSRQNQYYQDNNIFNKIDNKINIDKNTGGYRDKRSTAFKQAYCDDSGDSDNSRDDNHRLNLNNGRVSIMNNYHPKAATTEIEYDDANDVAEEDDFDIDNVDERGDKVDEYDLLDEEILVDDECESDEMGGEEEDVVETNLPAEEEGDDDDEEVIEEEQIPEDEFVDIDNDSNEHDTTLEDADGEENVEDDDDAASKSSSLIITGSYTQFDLELEETSRIRTTGICLFLFTLHLLLISVCLYFEWIGS